METIVQWATILSPIIAVLIAVWVVICSKKDANKQIESIKALSRQQIEASIKQVELEIAKMQMLTTQAKQEWEGVRNINESGLAHIMDWKNGVMRDFQENKPERDYLLYNKFLKNLESIKNGLVNNLKELN